MSRSGVSVDGPASPCCRSRRNASRFPHRIVVDQPLRQRMFDTQATTDDHVMHIVGTAVDSLGNSYYKVKNSWGERAGRHGYWYASPAYVAGKTIELVLPRAALGVDPGDDAFRIER